METSSQVGWHGNLADKAGVSPYLLSAEKKAALELAARRFGGDLTSHAVLAVPIAGRLFPRSFDRRHT
jgi:hypothetical protein